MVLNDTLPIPQKRTGRNKDSSSCPHPQPGFTVRDSPVSDTPVSDTPVSDTPVSESSPAPGDGKEEGSDCRGRPCHDVPHRAAESSLLSHRTAKVNLKGLLNLLVIVVVVQNARLVLENLLKYGLLVKFLPTTSTLRTFSQQWPVIIGFAALHMIIGASYFTERYISPFVRPKPMHLGLLILKVLLPASMLAVPLVIVRHHSLEPVAASLLLCFSITWTLKLISFHHTLYDLRLAKHMKEDMQKICGTYEEAAAAELYPEGLTFRQVYLFMTMPTICFQLSYPRLPRIRWLNVIRHFGEMSVCLILMKIVVEQYMIKTVENTFSIKEMSVLRVFAMLSERILKLSIPNLILWLLMFVALFHHWLNILAELTKFADRSFYLDWWNAASFAEYWRKWNLPIHNFLQRHINKPLLRIGVPKIVASHIVFLLSALAHEYLVVVPLGMGWTGLVFTGFLFQGPLIWLTSNEFFAKHDTIANGLFWVSFCFTGQPLAVIVFSFLWGVQQGKEEHIQFGEEIGQLLLTGNFARRQ